MSKTRIMSHCLCITGIIILASLIFVRWGFFHGIISGQFSIEPPENSKVFDFYFIKFRAETNPKWFWKKPDNFKYERINLSVEHPSKNQKTQAAIFFPEATCEYNSKKAPFSKTSLREIITAQSAPDPNFPTTSQIDKIYDLLSSAGQGTFPRPRHHPYSLESNLLGSYVQYDYGGISGLPVGFLLLLTGILLRPIDIIIKKNIKKIPEVSFSISPMTIVILINFTAFLLGIFLNNFGGTIDKLGASLCTITGFFAYLLVPSAVAYSFYRRFNTESKKWDSLSIYLSVLLLSVLLLLVYFIIANAPLR